MDKNQTLSIIQLTTTYFQNFKITDLRLTVDAWYGILKDYEVEEVGKNLVDYVKTGAPFAPQPGQLLPKEKEVASKYVPSVEETKRYLLDIQHREALVLNDPELERIKEQAKEEIRKSLGIEKG